MKRSVKNEKVKVHLTTENVFTQTIKRIDNEINQE